MSTYEQCERKIAELHEKMFALQKEIEKVESEIVKAKDAEEWPKYEDLFYYISFRGSAESRLYDNCSDIKAKLIGNTFRTKEDAEFAVERLKVLAEMRKYACNIETPKIHCYIGYNGVLFIGKKLFLDGCIPFSSEEAAQACIDAIGADRLKKYYFGVTEHD